MITKIVKWKKTNKNLFTFSVMFCNVIYSGMYLSPMWKVLKDLCFSWVCHKPQFYGDICLNYQFLSICPCWKIKLFADVYCIMFESHWRMINVSFISAVRDVRGSSRGQCARISRTPAEMIGTAWSTNGSEIGASTADTWNVCPWAWREKVRHVIVCLSLYLGSVVKDKAALWENGFS